MFENSKNVQPITDDYNGDKKEVESILISEVRDMFREQLNKLFPLIEESDLDVG